VGNQKRFWTPLVSNVLVVVESCCIMQFKIMVGAYIVGTYVIAVSMSVQLLVQQSVIVMFYFPFPSNVSAISMVRGMNYVCSLSVRFTCIFQSMTVF
jgi:uncharacterized linocin/CFP29 family protein